MGRYTNKAVTVQMNSILHIPLSVRVVPTVMAPGQDPVRNQFSLEVTYKPNMPAQRFHCVHVPAPVAAALQDKALQCFHLVTLKLCSPEQHALPNNPSYVVLGAKLSGGGTVTAVPESWLKLQRNGLLLGVAFVSISVSIGLFYLAPAAHLVAVGLAAIGALKIAGARRIHTEPFLVAEGWGDFDRLDS
jgi:hypothetical protein